MILNAEQTTPRDIDFRRGGLYNARKLKERKMKKALLVALSVLAILILASCEDTTKSYSGFELRFPEAPAKNTTIDDLEAIAESRGETPEEFVTKFMGAIISAFPGFPAYDSEVEARGTEHTVDGMTVKVWGIISRFAGADKLPPEDTDYDLTIRVRYDDENFSNRCFGMGAQMELDQVTGWTFINNSQRYEFVLSR